MKILKSGIFHQTTPPGPIRDILEPFHSLMKKTRLQKSHATVPLILRCRCAGTVLRSTRTTTPPCWLPRPATPPAWWPATTPIRRRKRMRRRDPILLVPAFLRWGLSLIIRYILSISFHPLFFYIITMNRFEKI